MTRDKMGAIKIDELVDKDIVKLVKNPDYNGSYYIMKFDNNTYYLKQCIYMAKLYNELIAEFLACDYGIKCAETDLCIYNGSYYIMSKQIYKENEIFIPMSKLITELNNNLSEIWNVFEDKFKDRKVVAKLMYQLVDVFLFDVISANYDRHIDNYGILINNDEPSITPLYDNENIFDEEAIKSGLFCIGIEENDYFRDDLFTKFLTISDSSYLERLESKLWIIQDSNFQSIFDRIEQRINCKVSLEIKKDILFMSHKNYHNILKIINNIGKVR